MVGLRTMTFFFARTGRTLICLTVIGALLRLLAFRFNGWPHGDVVLDAAISESLAWHGRLLVPIVDVRYYPIGQFGFGYPPDQHPPLWPLLGASLTWMTGDGYTALRTWSLLLGVALIPLSLLTFRPALGSGAALWVAALVACAYLLVDFSGNGSLWILLAVLYLLFVWRATTAPISQPRNALALGVIIGLGFLVNYPAGVLAPALLLTAVLQYGRQAVSKALAGVVVAGAAALLTVSPWFAFNVAIHGNPLWSQPLQRQLGGGDARLDYQVVDGEVIKVNRPEPSAPSARLRTMAANTYGNIGFVSRQMLALAPVLNGFAAAAVIALALIYAGRGLMGTHDDARRLAPIVALLVCHGALALLWPTTKFRYLVPMFPLILALGAWTLSAMEPWRLRVLMRVICTVGIVCVSAWTWAVIPSHTYYYDGGVVTDNFGQQGETVWAEDARRIARASEVIRARGAGTILGDHLFYFLARQPLVVYSAGYPREVLEALADRYQVRYVWLEQTRLSQVQEWLGGAVIFEDGRFALLELR
jgi:4-amino-4-deoxy-L-arabinose transferase-like glycosyltransferase